MRPEQHYKMDITWWRRTGVSPFGDPTFAAPVAVKGHWRQQREIYVGADGEEHVSRSIVHVDRDMTEGDYIQLAISTNVDPIDAGAARINGWRKSSVPGKNIHVRRAYL